MCDYYYDFTSHNPQDISGKFQFDLGMLGGFVLLITECFTYLHELMLIRTIQACHKTAILI